MGHPRLSNLLRHASLSYPSTAFFPGVSTPRNDHLPSQQLPHVSRATKSDDVPVVRSSAAVEVHETRWRSAAKSFSWQVIDCGVTAIASYAFTHSLAVAGAMAGFHMFSDSILLYFHERIWNLFEWGRAGSGVDLRRRTTAKTFTANMLENLTTLIGAMLVNLGNVHVAG